MDDVTDDDLASKVRRFTEAKKAYADAKADLERALGHGLGKHVIDGYIVRVRARKRGRVVVEKIERVPSMLGHGGPPRS